ncbi:helix-turn-helix transcriptional regulator, partial [Salmonella enterica]|nr:helix-turn-helix transcriptional regulator [Salmonella enterica]
LKQVSTGVYDKNVKNIEISLPFCYFVYTVDKVFYISINGNVWEVKKKQAVFINKSVPFSILLNWGEGENCLVRKDIIGIRISQKAITDYTKRYLGEANISETSKNKEFITIDFSQNEKDMIELLDKLVRTLPVENVLGDLNANHVTEAKYNLLLSMMRDKEIGIDGIIRSCSPPTTADKVASLIMNDYSKNWKSQEIAYELNMSVSTLKRKMYSDTGSISHFITRMKMVEALRQLRRTDRTIGVIALSLGYTSPSYFTLVFKKTFNIFPSDVRKNDSIL